jgi:hypothetical protein
VQESLFLAIVSAAVLSTPVFFLSDFDIFEIGHFIFTVNNNEVRIGNNETHGKQDYKKNKYKI